MRETTKSVRTVVILAEIHTEYVMLLLESTGSGPYIVSQYMILCRYILVTYIAISCI